jgi:predicted Zn-dependent peptidase
MKKIFLVFGLIAPAVLFGQLDRSIQPTPAKAPTINIKDSEVFTTENGITVILSENHKLPKVAFNLVMGNNPIPEGNKAGLSDLTGSLIMSGTTSRTKDVLDNEIDYIGATLNASKNNLFLSCLTKHMDKGLNIMSDVLMNANFPQTEFDRVKKQTESSLMTAKSDPGTMADNAERVVNFPNHPYGENMTEATLGNITLEDVNAYYRAIFTPQGSYLVVVGDITKEQVTKMVAQYFGAWKGNPAIMLPMGKGQFNQGNRVFFVKKHLREFL